MTKKIFRTAQERHPRLCLLALLTLTTASIVGCPVVGITPTPVVGVAPGLNIEILDISIPADLRPVINFKATDDNGNIIPLAEFTDARFILAVLEAAPSGSTARFASYTTSVEAPEGLTPTTHATFDGARLGGVTANDNGTLTYRFDTALPADFDRTATHQLGGQFRRLFVVDGELYKTNIAHPFRPDGGTVTERRQIVATESCNECHTRLSLHGDIRRETQYCILCHQPQSVDANSGNTVDFAVMIHKIHRGADLPSVAGGDPYQIFGFRDSLHDFSTVEFPQDVRNCTVCHKDAPQADVYKTTPTLAGCASCHDRTWFGSTDATPVGFENHIGGMHTNDSLCALCHSEGATAAPVTLAHLLPIDSPAAVGLTTSIEEIRSGTGPKGVGTIFEMDFTLADSSGNPLTDMTTLASLGTTVAYPAPEYEVNFRENILSPDGTLTNLGDGLYTYAFATLLPVGSTDTFAVGIEGRSEFAFEGGTERQGIDTNAVTFFTIDSSEPIARRTVVDEENCNKCHGDLRMHGSLRTDVEYCLMCHHVNQTDYGRRMPAEIDGPPATVNFKDMIHKIHTGEELEGEYTVIGFGGRSHDFTEVRFPGDRRRCDICHTSQSTADLPTPLEALSTMVTQGETLISDTLPQRAACMACHDSELAGAHAAINTFEATETCAICHGPGADFAVSAVHALQP